MSCNKQCAFNLTSLTLKNIEELFNRLHNLLLRVKTHFWRRGPTVYSSSANPKLQYFQKLGGKKQHSEYKRPHQFIQRHLTSLAQLAQTCSESKADREQQRTHRSSMRRREIPA